MNILRTELKQVVDVNAVPEDINGRTGLHAAAENEHDFNQLAAQLLE